MTTKRMNRQSTEPDRARRCVLGGGLILLAAGWQAVSPPPAPSVKQAAVTMLDDGFVLIDGWVLPVERLGR